MTKTTGGTLLLGGVNDYTGATSVDAGILEVAGSSGTGAVSVITGGTLAGTGTVRGTTTIQTSGMLAPGIAAGSIGDLSWGAGADLTLATGSTSNFLLSAAPGTSDQLSGLGTITMESGAKIVVDGWDAAYAPVDGDSWMLLDWASIAGAFNVGTNLRSSGDGGGDLTLPDLSTSGLLWDVSSFTTSGSIFVVVPEPSRMMLMFVGVVAMLRRRRR